MIKILIFLTTLLISCSKDIKELVNKDKNTQQYWKYIREDNDEKIKEFLDEEKNKHIDVNKEMNYEGEISLTLAAKYNSIKVLNLLLNKENININSENNKKEIALMNACIDGYIEIVKLLLRKGSNVNHKDKEDITALMYSSIKGRTEIVKLLIDNGANINDKDKYSQTALIYASMKGYINIVKLLIDNGADVNNKDNYSNTALIHASIKGHTEVVKILIENKADVNIKDKNNEAALIHASMNGYKDITKLLIKEEVKINYNKHQDAFTSIIANIKNIENDNTYILVARCILEEMIIYNKLLQKSISKNTNDGINKEDAEKEINNSITLLRSLLDLPQEVFELIMKYKPAL